MKYDEIVLKYGGFEPTINKLFQGNSELYAKCLTSFAYDIEVDEIEKLYNSDEKKMVLKMIKAYKGGCLNLGLIDIFRTLENLENSVIYSGKMGFINNYKEFKRIVTTLKEDVESEL